MSADHIFVAHNDDLQQVQPPSQDDTWKTLEKWTVYQLRTWLGRRGVRSSEANKKDLVRIAYFTWRLALPINQDEVTTQKEAADRLERLLFVDGQAFPDPSKVSETEWVPDLKLLPTVTYPNIYNYLINTPGITVDKLKAYKSLESYNYAINGWVQELFVFSATDNIVFVKAKVKPSQHTSAPYNAWVMLRETGEVEAARCCCTAGLGEVCSHVGAILFKIMGAGLKGLNLPDACTSKACEWNRAFCKEVMPELLDNMNFELPVVNKVRKRKRPTRKPSRYSSSGSDEDDLWELLGECCPTAMGLCLLPQPNCTHDAPLIDDVMSDITVFDSEPIHVVRMPEPIATLVKNSPALDVFNQIRNSVSAEQSELVFRSTIGQTNNTLWHEVRKHRITASIMGGAYSFMKSSRKAPSISLMNDVMGRAKSIDHLPAIKWGKEHEEDALYDHTKELLGGTCEDLVFEKCGIKIPPGDAHIGASTDGLLTCSCHGKRLVEVKCLHKAATLHLTPQKAAEQNQVEFLQRNGKLKRSHKYYTQMQTQMAMLNVDKCDFLVWTPEGFLVESVDFDQQYWNSVKASVDSFYKVYVIPELIPNSKKAVSRSDLIPPPKRVLRKCGAKRNQ